MASTLLLLVVGCASFQPQPLAEVGLLERALSRAEGDLRVTVAVPTPDESAKLFGVDLAARGIQPVWLRVENGEDTEYFLFPIGMDPDYFSPQEAAWKSHLFLRGNTNRAIDAFFDAQRVPLYIAPRSTVSGFVYTNFDPGVKFVGVELRREGGVALFEFLVEIPGLKTDYQRIDFEALYPPVQIRDVDEAGLRAWLETLTCCALGGDETTPGDPMNIVVIGTPDAIFQPFIRRGWDVTETIHSGSVVGTVFSSVFRRRYRTSPVSPLYVFGRPQDIALQKARQTVDERNHLRLWLAPVRYAGMEVWVGQISRDIGVRMSRKTVVTHKIDPDVDEARYYLLQDLATSGFLAKVGHVSGVGFAGPGEPRRNYTGDPYFTDGLRVVLVLDDSYVPFDELEFLPWEDPAAFVLPFRPGARDGEWEQ